MTLQRILIATDFSTGAAAGLQRGLALARTHGATATVVHVAGAPPQVAGAAALSGLSHLARLQELRAQRATALLEKAQKTFDDAGVKASTKLLEGPAAETIAKAAADLDAELVVMGARGVHAEHVFAVGSVTEAVVHRATTNVLVVRGDGDASSASFDKLLVATDLSPASKAVIPLAIDFAAPAAEVELLHVVDWGDEPPEIHGAYKPDGSFKELWAAAIAEAERDLGEVTTGVGHDGGAVTHRVVEGVASHAILARAKDAAIDLIAVGKRGKPTHDSVAERIVRHAPCSVLVARQALDE